jgi:hypothetical protein
MIARLEIRPGRFGSENACSHNAHRPIRQRTRRRLGLFLPPLLPPGPLSPLVTPLRCVGGRRGCVLDPPSSFALSDHRPVNLSKCVGCLRLSRSLGSLSRSPPLPASSFRRRRIQRTSAARPDALTPEAPALAPDIRHVRLGHRPEQCIGGRKRRLTSVVSVRRSPRVRAVRAIYILY